jgi:hypothetical protein
LTGEAKGAAADASFLKLVRTGIYDVYQVTGGTTTATLGAANAPSRIDDESIVVTGISAGGTVTVRENWFPRWRASVDNETAPVVHRPDGYMDVTVPAGSKALVLRYQATALDWITRAVAFLAAVIAIAILVRARPTAPSELR